MLEQKQGPVDTDKIDESKYSTPERVRHHSSSHSSSPSDSDESKDSLLANEADGPAAANPRLMVVSRENRTPTFSVEIRHQQCPVFNELQRELAPHETVLVPDTHGSVLFMLRVLAQAGLAYFDAISWQQILTMAQLEDFVATKAFPRGRKAAHMDALSETMRKYRRLQDLEKPWDGPYLTDPVRQAQKQIALFEEKKASEKKRIQAEIDLLKNNPAAEEERTAKQAEMTAVIAQAEQSIAQQQAQLTHARTIHQDQRELDRNRGQFVDLMRKAFERAITERQLHAIPLREVIFIGDTTCDREAILGDIYRLHLAALAKEMQIPITEMASNHGWFTLQMRQFMHDRYAARDADTLDEDTLDKFQHALRAAMTESKRIDTDRLAQQLKQKKTVFDPRRLQDIFSFLHKIPERLFSEIDEDQLFLAQYHQNQKEADTAVKRNQLRLEKKQTQQRLHVNEAHFLHVLNLMPSKGPILLKLLRTTVNDCPELMALMEEEIGIQLKIEPNSRVAKESVAAARKSVSDGRANTPFNLTPAQMKELMRLQGKETLFQDVSQAIVDMLIACEMALKQCTTLPDSPNLYRESAHSLWLSLLPRHDIRADMDTTPDFEVVVVNQVRQTLSCRIRVGDTYECYSNSTNNPDGQRVMLESKTHTEDSFRQRMQERHRALYQTLDCDILTPKGHPTEPMQQRVGEFDRLTDAWIHSQCLIRRSSLKGDYITHAPGVIDAAETADQGMVRHTLVPCAQIMLAALKKNQGPSKHAARELYKNLQAALQPLQRAIGNNPTTHKNIHLLIDAINTAYRFFALQNLIATDHQEHIPDTHIGLFSRSPDADTYLEIARRAGRSLDGLPPDYGLFSENNPLCNWVYPFAAITWSRTDTATAEAMTYKDATTQAILLQLKHNDALLYGHTANRGPHNKGIDTRYEPGALEFSRRLGRIDKSPDRLSLQALTREADSIPSSFIPLFCKQLIEAANREDTDANTNRKRSASELQTVRVSNGQNPVFQIPMSLRELLQKKAMMIFRRLEEETPTAITRICDDLLQAVMEHPYAENSLKNQARLVREYLPPEAEAYQRANQAFNLRNALRRVNHNGGMMKHAQLIEFITPLYALDPETLALLPEEMALFFTQPGKPFVYPKAIAQKINATSRGYDFLNSEWRPLCETELNHPGTRELTEVTTTPLQNVFAALAIAPNVWISLAMFMLNWAVFLNPMKSFFPLSLFVTSWPVLLASSLFFLTSYTLLQFKSPLDKFKQKLNNQSPRYPGRLHRFLVGLVRYLDFLKKLLPQFSGLAHQLIFSFFLRPFVYIELAGIVHKMLQLAQDGELCPVETNATNTTTLATHATTWTPVVHLNATTAIPGIESYFGNPTYQDMYPYLIPAALWGVVVSVLGLFLSIIDPTTKGFPGEQSPARILDNFERSRSKRLRRAHWLWEGYNTWFDGNAFIGAGLYSLLYLLGSVCSSQASALAASCSMTALFMLRLLAYPPQWLAAPCHSRNNRYLGQQASPLDATKPSGNNLSCQELLLTKALPVSQKITTSALTLPLYFCFHMNYYAYFAYQYFGFTGYDLLEFSHPAVQGLWISAALVLGLLTIDNALSMGRDTLAADDSDRALHLARAAERNQRSRRRHLGSNQIATEPIATEFAAEDELRPRASFVQDLRGLLGSKHPPQGGGGKKPRDRSTSFTDDYQPVTRAAELGVNRV